MGRLGFSNAFGDPLSNLQNPSIASRTPEETEERNLQESRLAEHKRYGQNSEPESNWLQGRMASEEDAKNMLIFYGIIAAIVLVIFFIVKWILEKFVIKPDYSADPEDEEDDVREKESSDE